MFFSSFLDHKKCTLTSSTASSPSQASSPRRNPQDHRPSLSSLSLLLSLWGNTN